MFILLFFFFKQKTAYELRISDWSSDVCSSDLSIRPRRPRRARDRSSARAGAGDRAWSRRRGGGGGSERPGSRRPRGRVHRHRGGQIGRASCRERVCQYGSISVVAVSLNKKK